MALLIDNETKSMFQILLNKCILALTGSRKLEQS